MLLGPAFRYDCRRDAYVLRMVGRRAGPVLRPDRRVRREQQTEGGDRRHTASWA
jgi:hypothetical protein